MFSCEMCGNALCAYDVTFIDFTKAELCSDCLEVLEQDGKVLMSSRFAGLKD